VFLLVGQSNMDGYASNTELRTPYDAPQADVRIWQDDLGQHVGWTSLRGGFGGDSNKGSGGDGTLFGPEVSLGRAVADASPAAQFALIKHTQAGTAATMQDGWNPDRGNGAGPGQIWIDFVAKAHKALDALTTSQLDYQVAGMFVFQGSRDVQSETGVEAANYEQNFTHFISGVRQEFGVPQLPVVFAQAPDSQQDTINNDGWVMVRNAQEAVDPLAGRHVAGGACLRRRPVEQADRRVVRLQELLDPSAQLRLVGASLIEEGGAGGGVGLLHSQVEQRFFVHGRSPH
jgi:hypothetical protein